MNSRIKDDLVAALIVTGMVLFLGLIGFIIK